MSGLGDTTAFLARLRKGQAQVLSGLGEPVFAETTAFGANPGALTMLSYAPAGLPPGAPLVDTRPARSEGEEPGRSPGTRRRRGRGDRPVAEVSE